jgi:hypothetical protein
MRSFLLCSLLLLTPPALAEDAGLPLPPPSPRVLIPKVDAEVDAPSEPETQARLSLRCGPSLAAEVLLSTTTSPGGSCPRTYVSQEVMVRGPDGQEWLGFERSNTEGEPAAPPLELECREGTLRVKAGRAPTLVLKPKPEGGVSVDPSLEQELKRRLSAPASGRVEEARTLEYVMGLLPENESTHRLRALALVHTVREQVAAGDWRNAERAAGVTAWPDVAAAIREVERTLEEGRQKSQPLRALEPRRIGKLLQFPSLAPYREAGLFWRGRELCVLQQDDSGKMRCFDTGNNRWGALEPAPEEGPARSLESISGGCGAICFTGMCTAWGEGTPVGGTADGRLLVFEDGRWQALSEEGATVPSARDVSAAVALGPGGPVLGGGRYLLAGGDLFMPATGKDLRSWHLFSAPPQEPEGGRWLSVLVSPDQSRVAALSGASSSQGPFILWVARLSPLKSP